MSDTNPKFIYPDVQHPYYIVSPPYVRTSAGVRALHLLCHALNKSGETAYLLIYPTLPWRGDQVAPDLITPVLTQHIAQNHFDRGAVPITVYPETIAGNPFFSPSVVRYVMNFPGLLGGDSVYTPDELCFGYSKVLAEATNFPDNVLFLPATDTRIFYPKTDTAPRSGTCFYADKYKIAHNGKLFDVTKNSVEITRNKINSQTPQEIAELFRRSEIFYSYENTALALEAVLCGCPTVFLPNPYLSSIIALQELGMDGYAWGDEAAEVARAKSSVNQGTKNYLSCYETFWRDLEKFIAQTQAHVNGKRYVKPIYVPNGWDTIIITIKHRGILTFFRLAVRKIYKILVNKD